MRVVVSVGAKFHAFHLAEELQKRDCLATLMTSYYHPNRNGKGYNIDDNLVLTNFLAAVLTYGHRFLPILRQYGFWEFWSFESYSRWAARRIAMGLKADIFVAWSGWALDSIKVAKQQGMITILERGSAHIVRQKEILLAEYKKFDDTNHVPSDYMVNKEVREYAEADYISVPSSFAKRSFVEQGFPAEKLLKVPYGVSLEHFRPAQKEDDVFRVMHIGGNLLKGTHFLIDALNELELFHSELLLIGTPSLVIRELLRKFKGKYKVLDHVPHLELYTLYSQCSVYVLPSLQEGLAMVQVEAMACGIPVVCSTNTGGEDIIRNGIDGFVVPVRDVDALKEKILYLYENETERREMGLAALTRAQEFTWDRYGERIVKVYSALLADSTEKTP